MSSYYVISIFNGDDFCGFVCSPHNTIHKDKSKAIHYVDVEYANESGNVIIDDMFFIDSLVDYATVMEVFGTSNKDDLTLRIIDTKELEDIKRRKDKILTLKNRICHKII